MSGFGWWLRDSWEMVKRNLIHIKRTPELLLDVTLSPIMFVLLFSFVFGGAIDVGSEGGEDASYVNFLMAGIFVQTVAFAGHLHRRAARERPAEGDDRPIPLAADVAVLGADRPHPDRPAARDARRSRSCGWWACSSASGPRVGSRGT